MQTYFLPMKIVSGGIEVITSTDNYEMWLRINAASFEYGSLKLRPGLGWAKQGSFWVCAQPMRTDVTMQRRLSLAGRMRRMIPGYGIPTLKVAVITYPCLKCDAYLRTSVPQAVSHAWISNCIPQYSMGCNCSSLPEMSASSYMLIISYAAHPTVRQTWSVCPAMLSAYQDGATWGPSQYKDRLSQVWGFPC